MTNVIGLVLVVLFSGAALTALFAMVALLLPGPVAHSTRVLQAAPGRAFGLGLVNVVFSLALVLLVVKLAQAVIPPVAPVLGVLALLILGWLLGLAALGLTGLVVLLRDRMGASASPLLGLGQASGLMLLAALTPVVGWWVFAPLAVISAVGAGLLALIAMSRRAPAAQAAAQPAVEE